MERKDLIALCAAVIHAGVLASGRASCVEDCIEDAKVVVDLVVREA